jgi:signal transduction histidine kinase
MKSIRRTLILNVTLLLVLALGAVGAIVYRVTQAAIADKQHAAREQEDEHFNAQRDEVLLNQARAIAGETQSQFDPAKFRQLFEVAAALSLDVPFGPSAHVAAPVWIVERMPGALSWRVNLLLATDVKLGDSEATRSGLVQVNTDWGNAWRSQSVSGPELPFDVSHFNSEQRIQWLFDDVILPDGEKARRVQLKTPLMRSRVLIQTNDLSPERASLGIASGLRRDPNRPDRVVGPPWFFDPRGGGGRRSGGRPPTQGGNVQGFPTIYIQVAWDKKVDHPEIARHLQRRDQQLAKLDDENRLALAGLRRQLIWIGVGTLATVVLGGWLLVGAGLAPLKRLSHAVSRVSAKDFKLPIEPQQLPREVAPVGVRLQQTLQQLQEAFAREKRASADISHELRTPLAALTTTLEVALRKPRTPEVYQQTLEDARQIARQMSMLVERMLALAWLDAGADQVRPEAVDVDLLVAGCAAVGKPLAEAQGLSFQVKAERPLTIRTDPDKLREVVMNLLHNAIEYNRPGGAVEICAAAAPAGGVVVEVRDTGVGIPEEMREKIFERFYRGDPSRNAAGVHAGLGLAIVKEYVDRLGGRLSLESTVGSGSRFRVELPNV